MLIRHDRMFWGMTDIKAKKRYVLFWDCARPTVVVFYRRFGKTYRSCRQLSNCLAFEDGTFRLFEMSVRNCHPRLRNIPEERASHLHRVETLKSCKGDEALVTYGATNHSPLHHRLRNIWRKNCQVEKFHTNKQPPPVPIQSQLDPIHVPTSNFLKIHLNIIIPSAPGFPKWSLSFRFPYQNPVYTSPPPIRATFSQLRFM